MSIHIGQYVRMMRIRRGLSTRELCRLSGCSKATLNLIENGFGPYQPSVETLLRLGDALGTRLVRLPPGVVWVSAGDKDIPTR